MEATPLPAESRHKNKTGDANSKYTPPDDKEFFIEPAWCVRELFRAQRFVGYVWDPACGSGTIPTVAMEEGLRDVIASDLVIRWEGTQWDGDFLKMPYCTWARSTPVNVVSNPPYSLAAIFAQHALAMPNMLQVWLLVNQKFLWSRERRDQLFAKHPPARVLILSDRPSMPPGDAFLRGEVKRGGGMKDFCWVGWSTTHRGPTQVDWLIHTDKPARGKGNGKAKKEAAPSGE